jgi:cobyrinic acid a,c-diamide synthase
MPRLVVAGTASGVGKTTVTASISAALRRRGRSVAPFKVGPDYIDPTYHTLATGRVCRNLDGWLVPPATVRGLFARAALDADLAIVEGVLGLLDGRLGEAGAGSTAEVAALLEAPIVLVLDVGRQARSAAAVARGFQTFGNGASNVGVVLNRVGSARHEAEVRREVEAATGLPVLGSLSRDAAIELPERHLGLIPSEGQARAGEVIARLGELAEERLDLDAIERLASAAPALAPGEDVFPRRPARRDGPVLAVARDEAFSFYYQDNLDLLAAYGARLVEFSPLREECLPKATAGLYLGGGFPELFAGRLAGNRPLLREVRARADEGLPIYAECGGLMYLAQGLTDFQGERHGLAGVLPNEVAMGGRRAALGYRRVRTLTGSPLAPPDVELRSHEFHWSSITTGAESANAFELLPPDNGQIGYASPTLLASYLHLHFGGRRELPEQLVRTLG